MKFIDSHAHLADPAFDTDREAVIAAARLAGAAAVVVIGESIAAGERARTIAGAHAGFAYFTAGVHPHDAAEFQAARDLPLLETLITQGAVAVGECGLDYHYDHSPRPLQLAALEAQFELARKVARPVVLHTREAEEDTSAMVTEAGRSGVCGVLHCFTGTHALARAALDAGWYISLSGIITFRKFVDDDLLRLVPDDRLLVESDSPYLAPVPNRGKRNEPAWVVETLQRLARARLTDATTMGARTLANTRTLFGLPEVD